MNGELRLRLVGDVMLGCCVDETIGRRGFRYPCGDVLRILIQVDLLICNLEATLAHRQRVAECVRRCDATLTARQQVRPGVVTLATAHLRSVAEMGVWGATEPMLADRWSITQPRTGAEGVTLL